VRHYFGYDTNGVLRSVEVYGPAGWPSSHCVEDPDCQEDAVTSLREGRANNAPDVIDWVLFDCSCDPAQGALLKDCVCYNAEFAESYVNTQTKTLVKKPLRTVQLDNKTISNNETITHPPGTKVVLKIISTGMPDGETAHCTQKGAVDLTLDDEWDLTFEGGVTDAKTLTAPAQGTKGVVAISGKMMRPITFCLRGFEDE